MGRETSKEAKKILSYLEAGGIDNPEDTLSEMMRGICEELT